MTQPVTPADLNRQKATHLPDFVIQAVNELLAWSNSFTQNELVNTIMKHAPAGTKRQDVYQNKWLDIEHTYQLAGWKVTYDRPGYNECYPATFTFEPK